jgi:predicted GH43/DUF377 family glycosyl hydrolase
MSFSRRHFLLTPLAPAFAAVPNCPDDLRTPYKCDRLVVAPSGVPGAFDEKGADCPFVFRHKNRYFMTYIGFDGVGYQTGLASSEDLLNWKKEGVILPRDPSSPITRYNVALTWIVREEDVSSSGRLRLVRGRYLGVYHAYPQPGYESGPAVIGLCWSRDLHHWKIDPPCLRAEGGAAWESAGLYKACLFESDGHFYLVYNAKDRPAKWREQTGVAVSTDLKNWRRLPSSPLLRNGPAGSPDEIFASDPCVLRYHDQWAVFYFGLDRAGVARDLLALSNDLNSAIKCPEPLVDVGLPGSVDSQYAHKPSVICHHNTLYHFYCAVSKEHGRGISVAASRAFR